MELYQAPSFVSQTSVRDPQSLTQVSGGNSSSNSNSNLNISGGGRDGRDGSLGGISGRLATSISSNPSDSTPATSPTSNRRPSYFTSLSGSSSQSSFQQQPIVTRHGRKYINDPSLPYPLPVDITELNRQNLRHLLFKEVFGSYHTAQFGTNPKKGDIPIPNKILDLGCGTGCWSASMADEFASRFGKRDVEFYGLDLIQCQPDLPGVNFKFIQHNFLEEKSRLPFEKETFDMVFLRELTMCIPNNMKLTNIISDCIRVLKPGGVLEIQCTDLTIRSLPRMNAPRLPSSAYQAEQTTAFNLNPHNRYLLDWNKWITSLLTAREVSTVPCTLIGPSLLMERDSENQTLASVTSKRLALPFDEIWWESEAAPEVGVSMGFGRNARNDGRRGQLSEEEKAVRGLAKSNFAKLIESLEPLLREEAGLKVEEWDKWYREVMANFVKEGGLKNGECLEFGAWVGIKNKS